MRNKEIGPKFALILSMVTFGTIGIFRRYIEMPSGFLASLRGFVGGVFLILVMVVTRKKPNYELVKKHLFVLIFSGVLIGINWIFLFEAYNYTSVAVATLCYYMAPMFVVIASAILFREKMTFTKMVCTILAVFGMVLVSGVLESGFAGSSEMKGVIFGLLAALLYATIVLMSRVFSEVPAFEKTTVQLLSAAIVLVPYVLLKEDIGSVPMTASNWIPALIVGVVHTGIAYTLYFGNMPKLRMQTVAILSYIDPIVAVILSAVLLQEKAGILGWIGTALVLGATFANELLGSRKKE